MYLCIYVCMYVWGTSSLYGNVRCKGIVAAGMNGRKNGRLKQVYRSTMSGMRGIRSDLWSRCRGELIDGLAWTAVREGGDGS